MFSIVLGVFGVSLVNVSTTRSRTEKKGNEAREIFKKIKLLFIDSPLSFRSNRFPLINSNDLPPFVFCLLGNNKRQTLFDFFSIFRLYKQLSE